MANAVRLRLSFPAHRATHFMVSSPTTLTIDIVSDVVCPWCYIGKRHLEQALAQWHTEQPDINVSLRWHPFQLNPELGPEGIDRKTYLEEKFGGAERAAEIYERVKAAGRNAGLELNIEGINRQPNTLAAHLLIAYVQTLDNSTQPGRVDAVVESLFRAYFIENRFIGDANVLLEIAQANGVPFEPLSELLSDGNSLRQIAEQDAGLRSQGIRGVPFFIFNNRVALSGAQLPSVILDAMRQGLQAGASV